MNTSLRVVIITTRLPEDIWLINKLADVCQIEGIILPTGKRYREYDLVHVLKKRLRWGNLISLANQTLLIIYRLIVESRRDKRAVKEIFSDKPTDYIEKDDIDIFEVKDVNSEAVKDYILSKAPQLAVVSGAPLLKKRIIEAAKGNIINLHPGFAPQYRGRYGAYWPIYNKEPELVGVTVHYINGGIDTGAILLQQQIDYSPDDTLKTITYKQHRTGVDLLIKCLKDYERLSSQAYHKNDCPSKNYLAPGLTHYLKARRWLKLREKKNEIQ
jgi:methionyl-tRNA formyltransferase